MGIADVMNKLLSIVVFTLVSFSLCAAFLSMRSESAQANGKIDPLRIVSEAERMPAETEVALPDNATQEESVDTSIASFREAYLIGPSDKLRVTVYGEKDLSKVYQVDGLGIVSVPLVGQIKVAGMTLRQAEDLLIVALSNGYLVDPSVAIEIAEFRPFYIMGEVRRPGSYNYIDGMSILNAIAVSGGYTYRANTKRIEVIRSDAKSDPVIVDPTSQVMPGDIIRVKERFF